MPELTILMTTYNEDKKIFLKAIESIQNQSYSNFNILIIVDNKENKEILEILEEKVNTDKRIRFVVNQTNLGLPLSLNKGIDMINTKYIARMDADDIACYDRIEKQINFANANPDIDLFGTNINFMDYDEKNIFKRADIPENHEKISYTMEYKNVMNHPTFFGKTEIFKKLKYRDLKYSQDYDFCCRLIESNYVIGNINKYLLMYRNPKNIKKEKVVFQNITYYNVQKYFRKKILNNIDIKTIVDKEFLKINVNKCYYAIEMYDKGIKEIKNKKYLKSLLCFFKSFICSKYQRKQIMNILMYKLQKRS